jgi:membrane dipeptidase
MVHTAEAASALRVGNPIEANRGFHPVLGVEQKYTFVDACVQIWRDADLPNAHRHGVDALAVTTWDPHASLSKALESIMYWHLVVRRHPNLLLATHAEDIRRAKREHRLGLILASQDGDFIGDKLHRVEAFHRLGLRMLIPAYNLSNQLCDGALDRTDGGLTRAGQLVVTECNRLGILLDCSHIGRRASLDIMERSSATVIFSHSNPRGVVENPRSADDEQIRACARRGGVLGVVATGSLTLKKGMQRRANLSDFADNIDYIAQLTGTSANIGIGSDFSLGTYPVHRPDPWGEPGWDATLSTVRVGFNSLPGMITRPSSPVRYVDGFNSYAEAFDLIELLETRGYTHSDIAGIMGENFLRVFAEVWK